MATVRKRKLKNGRLVYDIQVRIKDKGSGEEIVETSTWRADENMNEKKADNEAVIVADKFEKEVIASISGCSARSDLLTITFRDFANNQLEQTKRKWTLSYYVISKRALDFACSRIGGYKVKELTPAIIQNFFNEIDNRTHNVSIITPKPNFKEILKSYGFDYKNLRYDYHVQAATLSHALRGQSVGVKWSNELCRATKIPFNKLFDTIEKKEPYAWETNNKIKRTVRAVLSLAKKNRLVEDNFAQADYIDYPKKVTTPIRFMDDKTAVTFFDFLMSYHNLRIKTAMLIFLLTGFRRGEVCGLEWHDIDFEKRTISVERSVVYVSGYGVFQKEPKTEGSKRTITVAQVLINVLKEYRESWLKMREDCGDYIKPSDKLFTSQKGDLINPATLETWIKIVIRDSGMEHFTLHSLRHTNITLQIAKGIPLVTVAARAGHSRTSTTSDIYSHFIKTSDENAADALDNFFNHKNN